VASPNLKPEQSQCLEAGLQTSFLNNKLQLSVTGFARKVTNVIVYTFSTGGYINQDEQRDFGAEFKAKYKVNKYLALDAFYTFTDGAVTTKSSSNTDTTFYNLIRVPKHTFAVSAQVSPTRDFSITIQVQYMGNRIDYYYDPNQNYASVQEPLSQYALLNLYLQYKLLNNHLTLFTDLRNMANSKFVEVYGYNTQGFNITGGIRFIY
jgi:vitamin B12 transporter